MSKFKGTETVKSVMVKEVKTYKNVQNAKAEELLKSSFNLAPACTPNHPNDAENAGARARS